jgi:hypothetical protein
MIFLHGKQRADVLGAFHVPAGKRLHFCAQPPMLLRATFMCMACWLARCLQDEDGSSDEDDDVDDDEALEEALLQGGKMAQRERF